MTEQQERQVKLLEQRYRSFARVYAYGNSLIVVIPGPRGGRVPVAATFVVEPNGATRQAREVAT